ncbi:hypothetical protein S83_058180, partial [Arachis hypogaea]
RGGDGNGEGRGGDGNGAGHHPDGADPERAGQGGDGIQEADLCHHEHVPLLPDRSSNEAPRTAQVKESDAEE